MMCEHVADGGVDSAAGNALGAAVISNGCLADSNVAVNCNAVCSWAGDAVLFVG